jgi:hypothetical protein
MQPTLTIFDEEVKAITKNVEGVSISLTCVVGAGMAYSTIKDITTAESDEKTELVHDG